MHVAAPFKLGCVSQAETRGYMMSEEYNRTLKGAVASCVT
jgi:hypothetical protein